MTTRSLRFVTLRFAGWTVLIGALALAACSRSPSPPEKVAIAAVQPGTASGFAALHQNAAPDRNQEESSNRFDITTSYAFFDHSSPEYFNLVLLDAPLDNQKLAEASDPADVANEALRNGANGVLLMFDGKGGISGSFRMSAGGKAVQFGGTGTGEMRGLERKGDRLVGHVHYFGSTFGDNMAIDSSFDAPLILPAKGTPMPADGGDPGAAYLENLEAMRAGDVDKLIKLMSAEQAKMIVAERGKPDFQEKLDMLKEMAPDEVEVTGGMSFGERVVLTTKGTEGKQPFTGEVEMAWKDDDWRVIRSSQSMGDRSSDSANAKKEPDMSEKSPEDKVPVLVDDGAVGKGFMVGREDFSPTEGFAIDLPDEYEDNVMMVLLSDTKLEPQNAKAMWDNDTPTEIVFADGKIHRAIRLIVVKDEDGELKVDKATAIDAEGNFDDAYVGFNAIEYEGKVLGTLTQQGSINDVEYAGVARFNLPVLPAP